MFDRKICLPIFRWIRYKFRKEIVFPQPGVSSKIITYNIINDADNYAEPKNLKICHPLARAAILLLHLDPTLAS